MDCYKNNQNVMILYHYCNIAKKQKGEVSTSPIFIFHIFYKIIYVVFCYLFFSHIFLTTFNDNVDKVNPITGTNELKNILSIFLIT